MDKYLYTYKYLYTGNLYQTASVFKGKTSGRADEFGFVLDIFSGTIKWHLLEKKDAWRANYRQQEKWEKITFRGVWNVKVKKINEMLADL